MLKGKLIHVKTEIIICTLVMFAYYFANIHHIYHLVFKHIPISWSQHLIFKWTCFFIHFALNFHIYLLNGFKYILLVYIATFSAQLAYWFNAQLFTDRFDVEFKCIEKPNHVFIISSFLFIMLLIDWMRFCQYALCENMIKIGVNSNKYLGK